MHYGVFLVTIYDLPLMVKSKTIEKKMCNILSVFEEIDMKEGHHNEIFMKFKVMLDLKKPLEKEKGWLDSRTKPIECS